MIKKIFVRAEDKQDEQINKMKKKNKEKFFVELYLDFCFVLSVVQESKYGTSLVI